MSARSDLSDYLATIAPAWWEIYPYPADLKAFDIPGKTVAVVIMQTDLTTGTHPDTSAGVPVVASIDVWAVVDGTRGANPSTLEDDLEDAAEALILAFSELPDHVWDGKAERGLFDPQKPAYRFTITAHGAITPKE